MNDKSNPKKRRPLSHNQLLKFKREENFIFENKFMNDELRLKKYNLKNLHKKWAQKVQTNFLQMDIKFESSSKNPSKNKIIYQDSINKKELYIIPKFLYNNPYLIKKNQNILLSKKVKDKYDDKTSYYLSQRNPWNKQTSIEVSKNNNNSKNFNVHEKIMKELNLRNEYKKTNESKI